MKTLRGIVIALFVVSLIFMLGSQWLLQHNRDNQPPTLTCPEGVLEVSVQAEPSALLQGLSAQDNRDGDITDKIMVEHISGLISENTARITYVVFDSSDNAAKCTRTVRYTDYQKPRFRLTAPLQYYVGDTITLQDRLSAVDELDGDISEKIRLTASNLSNTLAGTYHVTVQVTNSLGDTTVLPLTILVEGGSSLRTPSIQLSDYLVYLDAGSQFDPHQYLQKVTDPAAPSRQGNLNQVEILSEVEPEVPGVYEVTYSYEGTSREGKVILTVVVI